jgi:hypothetical protein
MAATVESMPPDIPMRTRLLIDNSGGKKLIIMIFAAKVVKNFDICKKSGNFAG